MKLTDALAAIVTGDDVYRETETGLRIQFRRASDENPHNRLLCYRLGYLPTLREFTAVRQQLEELIPNTDIVLGNPLNYVGKDGKLREGRAFSWIENQLVQKSLFEGDK